MFLAVRRPTRRGFLRFGFRLSRIQRASVSGWTIETNSFMALPQLLAKSDQPGLFRRVNRHARWQLAPQDRNFERGEC
jgi:hypothetical protein